LQEQSGTIFRCKLKRDSQKGTDMPDMSKKQKKHPVARGHPLKGRGQEKKLPYSKKLSFFFESSLLADRFLTAPVISRVYYVSCAAPVTHQDLGRSGFESCKTASIRKALSAFSGPENLRFHTVFNLQTAWLGYQPLVTHGMGSKKTSS